MRRGKALFLAVLLSAVPVAWAGGPGPCAKGKTIAEDPVLRGLVAQTLENRPEIAAAMHVVQALNQRVPQAGALPDPALSIGMQNNSFNAIEIGQDEGSWYSISASQTIPRPKKLSLRAEVAKTDVRQAEADEKRVRLSIRAEVERAYVDLLLAREQLALLENLGQVWTLAEGNARARFQTGESPQADLLRAQLEKNRLRQKQWLIRAWERQTVAALNRLRGHPLDEAIETPCLLSDMADPALPDLAQDMAQAEKQSPEVEKADLGEEQSRQRLELAKTDYFPDLGVNMGIMPRGGEFDTMWQVGLSATVPVWAGSRQTPAVFENEALRSAARQQAQAVRQLLHQRVEERYEMHKALLEANRLYRSGLLIQSEAAVKSTLALYRVGNTAFASVLETLAGYVSDKNGFLESLAGTQRIDIARREISLDGSAAAVRTGPGGASLPGAGGMGSGKAQGTGSMPAPPVQSSGASSPGM